MAAGVKPPRQTIFHALLEADAETGRAVRSTQNLADESMSLTSAAADSTGNAMAYAVFSVLSDSEIHKRVLDELRQSFPDDVSQMDMTSLEKLPYFMGVIKEAQRYDRGKPHRELKLY
jgi:cytochrome P450